jgi:filamentous hemagglutinin
MKNQTQNKKIQLSLKNRITAVVMASVMLLQILVPGIAAAAQIVSDTYVAEAMVNPQFQVSNNNSWLYEKTEFSEATNLQHQSIETFHGKLRDAKFGLSNPTMVPIAGDITIFVPVYLPGKLLGDAYVQNRFIRQQVFNQLGRHIIDPVAYATEVDQNNTLYNNAYSFANENRQYLFGSRLPADLVITRDMIWPEKRNINGQDVIAPIVYLTPSTLQKWSVTDHKIEFLGSSANFYSMTLDHQGLMTGLDTWIETVNGFTNYHGNVSSAGNLNLDIGGIFQNIGGSVSAEKMVKIFGDQIIFKTLVHSYTDKYGQGTRLGQIADTSGQQIYLYSKNDITFEGATATATNGTITMEAGGNINIQPVYTQYNSKTKDGHWQVTSSSLDVFGSKISATDTIKLIAEGAITIDASELVSTEGGIELLASQGIHVLDELTQEQIQKVDRKGKTTGQSSEFRTEAVRAVLSAGKGVLLDTEFGDVTLKASKITSNDGAQVYARNGTVHLLMTKEHEQKYLQTVRKSTWKIKTRTEDIHHENNIQNAIVGGLQVQAMYGINLEYTGKEGASLAEQIEEFRNMPGMEWMAKIYDQSFINKSGDPNAQSIQGETVNWETVEEVHRVLRKSKSTLSPAAMAIIAICVAVAMGPAAGAINSGVSGATAGALGSGAAATAFGSAVGAAVSAGAVTLTTQAAQSLASGNNLRETLNAMDSDESLKSLAVSMVTAGALEFADVPMFEVPVDDPITTLNLAKQAAQAVVNATVSAGVSLAINGGNSDDFRSAFVSSVAMDTINFIGEKLAKKIGDAAKLPEGERISVGAKYIAHAALGCMSGALTNELNDADKKLGCASGAGGAVIGEYVGSRYADQLNDELNEWIDQSISENGTRPTREQQSAQYDYLKSRGVDLARLAAALGAFATGGDVNIAANSGRNAAQNNALFLFYGLIDYLKLNGDGDILKGLAAVGAREDFLTQIYDSLVGEIDAFGREVFRIAAEGHEEEVQVLTAVLNELYKASPLGKGEEAIANAMTAGINVVIESELGVVSTKAWNELTETERNQVKGAGRIVEITLDLASRGRVNAVKQMVDIPEVKSGEINMAAMINDKDHPDWNKVDPEIKESILIRDLPTNKIGTVEVNIKSTPLEAHDRLNKHDLSGNGAIKSAEAAMGAQLEGHLGTMKKYEGTSSDGVKSPDWEIVSGPYKGKKVDAMYTTDELTQKEIDGLNKYYEESMTVSKTPGLPPPGITTIQDHLKKADFVPVDFRVLNEKNQKVFLDYVSTLPPELKIKIIVVR